MLTDVLDLVFKSRYRGLGGAVSHIFIYKLHAFDAIVVQFGTDQFF